MLIGEAMKLAGAVMLAMFMGIQYFFYSLMAFFDRLFGAWGSTPAFSWGLTGMVLGTATYFAVNESRKLSWHWLNPFLCTACLMFVIASPLLGQKTGKRPQVISPVVIPKALTSTPATPVKNEKILSGVWIGTINNKHAEFNLNHDHDQVSGNVKYDGVTETLTGSVSGGKVSLKGTHWVGNVNTSNFSLDSFIGEISTDGKTLYGQYSDTAGHKGNWNATYQGRIGKKQPTSPPPQVVQGSEAQQQAKRAETPKELFNKGELLFANSPREAIQCFVRSADKGYLKAQRRLGSIYYNGKGVAQDYYESAKWYRMAAENGDADAQCFYGSMIINGYGVERDKEAGKVWLKMAAAKGNIDAKKRLDQLEGR